MKNLFLISLIVLASCLERGKDLKHEKAIIVAKQYQSEVNAIATGVGYSTSGNVVITTHSIHEDQKFNVVFKCDHGVIFTINRDNIYCKVKEGDTVLVNYYELVNSKGEVRGFDFIDCNK